MAATLTDPLLGHLIDGRYEVLSRIARGGMATVYLAVDRRLDREVALKVMHPHLAEGGAGSEFVARFRREARAAARLTHPGLVGVFDQGVDGETSYLTMEYIDGTNLRRRLGEVGALTVREAFDTAECILEALAAAHRAGLVHRDVKPENVLLAADGRIKVADFGLARAVTEVTATTTGTVLGTVAYLAPELVAHGTSDARTDVYAVGILLFEMLTGRQPFTGATPIQVAYQHVNSDVPAPSERVDWFPAEIDELVGALAARDPADRPLDARGALDLLRRTRRALDDETLDRAADVRPTTPPTSDSNEIDPGDGPQSGADRSDDGDDDDAPSDLTGAEPDASRPEPDGDATEALQLYRPRPRATAGRHDEDDDERGLSRTVALRIGTGLDAPDETTDEDATGADGADGTGGRSRGRRLAVLLVVVVAVAGLLGGLGWWYMTSGPGAYTAVPGGVVGAERSVAEGLLSDAGLTSEATEVYDPAVPAGDVVSVVPGEGERILKEGSVALEVSKGPDMRLVPANLPGRPLADVSAALEGSGFAVPEPDRAHSDTVPLDHVIAVAANGTPLAGGEELPKDTPVHLTVSDGPEPLKVISVVGTTRDVAVQQLTDQGLKVAEQQDYSEQHAAGTVMAQSPEPGADGHRMDTVTITISQGPPLVEVPGVVGSGIAAATQTLEALGLVVERDNYLGAPGGFVLEQSIPKGEIVPKGTTITLRVF